MTATGSPESPPALAAQPFFQGLSPELVAVASRAATFRTFREGEFLLHEGRTADSFLVVVDGKVALEVFAADRRRITVQTLGRGEVLGWSWLLPPHRWTVDAIAVKTTRAHLVDANALRAYLAAHPADGYQFLLRLVPVLSSRLHSLRVQLLEADVL